MSDFSGWDPQEPPPDFAERVMARVTDERRAARAPSRTKRSRLAFGVGLGVAAIAAAAVLVPARLRTSRGDIVAEARTQASLGPRVVGVLEPGAHVRWEGDALTQDAGDVFYRVERGGPLVVHTPAGDVDVLGTCFRVRVDMNKRDVKSAAVGAGLAAVAFVAVYEGKVAVSHAAESVQLSPGEAAKASSSGVEKLEDGRAALDDPSQSGDPAMEANRNLADSVRDYKRRLEGIEAQKGKLERQLAEAQDRLAAQSSDGAPPRNRSEFDLTPEDWTELAKSGTVKFRVPCMKGDTRVDAKDILEAGLAPQDLPAVQAAYRRSNERVWAQIRPLCAQAVGSAEVADKIGADTCVHLVLDMERDHDPDGARDAYYQVGEIQSGARPAPGAGEKVSPVLRVFMAMTNEPKAFEADLAQSFGPEEAHRVAYSGAMCMAKSTFGGPGPRKK